MNPKEYDEYRKTLGDRSQAALDAGDVESFVKMQVCHWAFLDHDEDFNLDLDASFREWPDHIDWLMKMMMIAGFGYFGYEISLSEQEAAELDSVQQIVDLLKKEKE